MCVSLVSSSKSKYIAGSYTHTLFARGAWAAFAEMLAASKARQLAKMMAFHNNKEAGLCRQT